SPGRSASSRPGNLPVSSGTAWAWGVAEPRPRFWVWAAGHVCASPPPPPGWRAPGILVQLLLRLSHHLALPVLRQSPQHLLHLPPDSFPSRSACSSPSGSPDLNLQYCLFTHGTTFGP